MARTILLVEDDREVAALIERTLEVSGYRTWHAENGADATAMLEQGRPDLILLDLMLPDGDGLVLLPRLRALTNVPIVVCSARDQLPDKVVALRLGADDFVPKPFDVYELEARVEAVLRRVGQSRLDAEPNAAPPESIRVGELVVDRPRRRVTLGDEPIQLTPIEYRLLLTLASRPDEVFSRDELAQLVWGYPDASKSRTIDMHIRGLRVKLAGGPVPPPAIVSVRGFGYMLTAERRPAARA